MDLQQLLNQIEAILAAKLAHEPMFTGSWGVMVNFQNGVPRDIIKEFEKSRELVTSK